MLAISQSGEGYNFFTIDGMSVESWKSAQGGKLPEGVLIAIDDCHPLYRKLTTIGHFEPVIQPVTKNIEEPVVGEDGQPQYDSNGQSITRTITVTEDDLVDVLAVTPPPMEIPPEVKLQQTLATLNKTDYQTIRALEAIMPKLYAFVGVQIPDEYADAMATRSELRNTALALEMVIADSSVTLDAALNTVRTERFA